MRRRPCSLPHRRRRTRISESLFITACSMDDHNEEKRTQQNLFVRSGKSEARVTNNRRLLSTNFCTVEATDIHEASRGLSATAGLVVILWLCRRVRLLCDKVGRTAAAGTKTNLTALGWALRTSLGLQNSSTS